MQLVKTESGVINVVEAHNVTREELVAIVEKAEAYVKESKENLAKFDELVGNAQTEPAPTPEPTPQPEVNAPVEQPVQPEAPVEEPKPEPQPQVEQPAPEPVSDDTAPVIQ